MWKPLSWTWNNRAFRTDHAASQDAVSKFGRCTRNGLTIVLMLSVWCQIQIWCPHVKMFMLASKNLDANSDVVDFMATPPQVPTEIFLQVSISLDLSALRNGQCFLPSRVHFCFQLDPKMEVQQKAKLFSDFQSITTFQVLAPGLKVSFYRQGNQDNANNYGKNTGGGELREHNCFGSNPPQTLFTPCSLPDLWWSFVMQRTKSKCKTSVQKNTHKLKRTEASSQNNIFFSPIVLPSNPGCRALLTSSFLMGFPHASDKHSMHAILARKPSAWNRRGWNECSVATRKNRFK